MTQLGTYKGRPIILFPDGWEQRHKTPSYTDSIHPNQVKARPKPMTKAIEWAEFRSYYYLYGIYAPFFGYEPREPDELWPGKPYAPWGISKHGVPKLHPEDD